MADGAIISISAVVWQKRAAEYWQAMGKNVRQGLNEEWPLLIRKIIDFTPPFKTKGQPGSSDLSIGRKAVAFDIYKTMKPFDPKGLTNKGLIRAVVNKDFAAFNAIASHAKAPWLINAKGIAFSPSVHTSRRNPRGRVLGPDVNNRVLGVAESKQLENYVASIQQRVGYAKSGWSAAYNLVADPEGRQLPAYVQRQGVGGGEVVDDRKNETNPSITAINGTPWAIRKDEGERIKADAYFSRAQAIRSKMIAMARLSRQQSQLNGHAA